MIKKNLKVKTEDVVGLLNLFPTVVCPDKSEVTDRMKVCLISMIFFRTEGKV